MFNYIIDVSNPLTLALLLAATVLLIFLGREIKKPIVPAIPLVFFLILVAIHSVQFTNIPVTNFDEVYRVLVKCIGIDFIMIFLTFISYLWVDDISCKFYKKKNIDNSLDWFWDRV